MKQDRDTFYPVVSQKVVLRKEGEDRFLCIDPITGAAAILNRWGVIILGWIRKSGGVYSVAEIIDRLGTKYRKRDTDLNNMHHDLYSFLVRCQELGLISFSHEKGGIGENSYD